MTMTTNIRNTGRAKIPGHRYRTFFGDRKALLRLHFATMNSLSNSTVVARAATVIAITALSFVPASAQTNRERFSVDARHADRPPRIDGILDEAIWQDAAVVDRFTQQEP